VMRPSSYFSTGGLRPFCGRLCSCCTLLGATLVLLPSRKPVLPGLFSILNPVFDQQSATRSFVILPRTSVPVFEVDGLTIVLCLSACSSVALAMTVFNLHVPWRVAGDHTGAGCLFDSPLWFLRTRFSPLQRLVEFRVTHRGRASASPSDGFLSGSSGHVDGCFIFYLASSIAETSPLVLTPDTA